MNIKPIARVLYGINGAVFLIAGGAVLLYKTPLLTDGIRDIILRTAKGDLNAVHLTQEFSSLMIGMGILSLWFTLNYDKSKIFHVAMTTFWGLLALIHWIDVRGEWNSIKGPIINTVPFILYLLVGFGRMA